MLPKIILDRRRESIRGDNSGKFHIKIKASIPVFIDGKQKKLVRRAKTNVFASGKEFKSIMGDARTIESKDKRLEVDKFYEKAKTVIKIPGLTPEQYISFMEGKGNFESITGLFDWYIAKCKEEDKESGEARDGNALTLETAKRFFCRYKGSDHISYAEITPEWLERCKKWALSVQKDDKGKVVKKAIRPASFYMYCRALRVIIRMAHKPFGKISEDSIPFGSKNEGKFQIPSTNKKKRKVKLELPLEKLIEQKNIILNYVSPLPGVNTYLNYWKASYFGNGANMADILRWKIGDYDKVNQVIKFERKKTENTEEENEPIEIFVGDELREIIRIEGNKSVNPDEYIFPILRLGMSSAERKKTVVRFIDLMNKSLKRTSKLMNLEIKLSSGSARYLMSTILDRSGIHPSVIKSLLGHESETTQSHYVSPYIEDLRKSISKILAG